MIRKPGFSLAKWIFIGVLGTLASSAVGVLIALSRPASGAPFKVTWGLAESGSQMLRAESVSWTRVMAVMPADAELDELGRRLPRALQGMLPIAPHGSDIQLLPRAARDAFWTRRDGLSWGNSMWRVISDGKISGSALGAAPYWFQDRTGWNESNGTLWSLQVTDAVGWPMPALTGTVTVATLTDAPPYFAVAKHWCSTRAGTEDWASGAVFGEDWPWTSGMIPFQPIALGFAMDTAFWGFLGFVASAAWRAVLRRRCSSTVRCGPAASQA